MDGVAGFKSQCHLQSPCMSCLGHGETDWPNELVQEEEEEKNGT